jgi:glycerol-3-phosphate O-acyltransferase
MICTSVNGKAARAMLTMMDGWFRHGSEGIYVDQPGITRVKALSKVVLVPTYKSFLDFFVLLYALYDSGIDLPFTFGHLDNERKKGMDPVLRKLGYVHLERGAEQSF